MFEFQVDRLTPEFARDFYQYLDEAFGQAASHGAIGEVYAYMVSLPERDWYHYGE